MVDIFSEATGLQELAVGYVGQNIFSLLTFALGVAIYAIFVWHFYKFISRRDVFKWEGEKLEKSGIFGKFFHGFFYIIKYLIAYPVLVFVWFLIFSVFIFILSGVEPTASLLISFAMVTAIRITSYYHEEISVDLGKMLPLAMLGVFLVQPDFLVLDGIYDKFMELPNHWFDVAQFMVVAIIIEWILRILWSVKRMAFGEKRPVKNKIEKL